VLDYSEKKRNCTEVIEINGNERMPREGEERSQHREKMGEATVRTGPRERERQQTIRRKRSPGEEQSRKRNAL